MSDEEKDEKAEKVMALATIDPTLALEPKGAKDAWWLAGVAAQSGLVQADVASQSAAYLIIATGRELGLTAMQSLRAIDAIDGRPSLRADAMVAIVKQRRDVCEYFRVVESDNEKCTVETKRVGDPGPTRLTYHMSDAKLAGLTGKKNWARFPRQMLKARAKAELVREVYEDIVLALYDPDELTSESALPPPADIEVTTASGEKVSQDVDVAALLQRIASVTTREELSALRGDATRVPSSERDAVKAAWVEAQQRVRKASEPEQKEEQPAAEPEHKPEPEPEPKEEPKADESPATPPPVEDAEVVSFCELCGVEASLDSAGLCDNCAS